MAELSLSFAARTGYLALVHSCTTVTVLSIISPKLELICVVLSLKLMIVMLALEDF